MARITSGLCRFWLPHCPIDQLATTTPTFLLEAYLRPHSICSCANAARTSPVNAAKPRLAHINSNSDVKNRDHGDAGGTGYPLPCVYRRAIRIVDGLHSRHKNHDSTSASIENRSWKMRSRKYWPAEAEFYPTEWIKAASTTAVLPTRVIQRAEE